MSATCSARLHDSARRFTISKRQDQGLSLPGDATKAAILAAQKGRDARLAKVANLKTELERKQAELDKVSATVLEAHRALGPIEAKINGERRVRVSAGD